MRATRRQIVLAWVQATNAVVEFDRISHLIRADFLTHRVLVEVKR